MTKIISFTSKGITSKGIRRKAGSAHHFLGDFFRIRAADQRPEALGCFRQLRLLERVDVAEGDGGEDEGAEAELYDGVFRVGVVGVTQIIQVSGQESHADEEEKRPC